MFAPDIGADAMLKRAAVFLLALAFAAPASADDNRQLLMVFKTKAKFEDVKEDVAAAIAKRGLVVDYTGHIGAMLDRTAKDVGATKTIYARAEAMQFCSATLSRKMMEADAANITHCPFVISIYALAGDPGTIHVAYRRPQIGGSPASQAALKEVGELLRAIVRDALKQ
jgi:uncharacterized protein (DUF302 family)